MQLRYVESPQQKRPGDSAAGTGFDQAHRALQAFAQIRQRCRERIECFAAAVSVHQQLFGSPVRVLEQGLRPALA